MGDDFDPKRIAGLDLLPAEEKTQFLGSLQGGGTALSSDDSATACVETEALSTSTADNTISQPKEGQKTKTSGQVSWKFAGQTFIGTLLPSRETETHCYARTHK